MAIINGDQLLEYMGVDSGPSDIANYAAAAAHQSIVDYCDRTFEPAATPTTRIYRATSYGSLTVNDFSTTLGLVVKTDDSDSGTYDTTWVIDTDFIVEPVNALGEGRPYNKLIAIGRGFPLWNRRPSVQITAAWGWSAVPAPVFQAALILGARLFKRRNSPEGVIGGFQEFGLRISRHEDPDVVRLLGPYASFNVLIA